MITIQLNNLKIKTKMENKKLQEALNIIEKEGYYVGSLWSVKDVNDVIEDNDIKGDLSEDDKAEALRLVLESEYVVHTIKDFIRMEVEEIINDKEN